MFDAPPNWLGKVGGLICKTTICKLQNHIFRCHSPWTLSEERRLWLHGFKFLTLVWYKIFLMH